MFTTTTLTALSAAVAVGFAACPPSAVAMDTETASVAVPYGDLNLASEAGAKIMLRRIRDAAAKVCGDQIDDPLDRLFELAPCVKFTTSRAVAQFHNPMVTALNSGKHAPRSAVELATR